jgi:hypothetical protein
MHDPLSTLAEAMGFPPEVVKTFGAEGLEMERWTERMDGIFTDEDRANKNTVMVQCVSCGGWTKKQIDESPPCEHCGGTSFDVTSATSLRTFNPLTAKRRKPKGKK